MDEELILVDESDDLVDQDTLDHLGLDNREMEWSWEYLRQLIILGRGLEKAMTERGVIGMIFEPLRKVI